MPEPGNPQSLNRYSYTRNNPIRFNDPSGYFEEEQLIDWYGNDWQDQFDEAWQKILLEAQFGDAITYGSNTAVFVDDQNMLAGWQIGAGKAQSIPDLINGWNVDQVALYRPRNVPQNGGATDGNLFRLGEFTSPEHSIYFGSNKYLWRLGNLHSNPTLELPLHWYRGWTTHVQIEDYFAGWDMGLGDIGGLTLEVTAAYSAAKQAAKWGGKRAGFAALGAAGGPIGLFVLVLDVADWTTWDSTYKIMPGTGLAPVIPAPRPPPY